MVKRDEIAEMHRSYSKLMKRDKSRIKELEILLQESRKDIMLSPKEICRKYCIQNCHCCEDINCGDNISSAKKEIENLEKQIKILTTKEKKISKQPVAKDFNKTFSMLISQIDDLKKAERSEKVLKRIKKRGPIALRDVEQKPPRGLTKKDVRIAIQDLLARGKIEVNNRLRLTICKTDANI